MIRLMLVDDESIFREHLCTTVEWSSYGFEICGEAENGREALEKLEICRPDIMLVDINMPFIDGLRLSEIVAEKYPQIAIVIVTGHDEFEYAKQAVRLGVKDYILKPFDNGELISALEKLRDKILKDRGRWYNYLGPDYTNTGFFSGETYENLLFHMKSRDEDRVLEELNRIFDCITEKKLSFVYTTTLCSALVSLCLSCLTESGKSIEETVGKDFSPLEEIKNKESIGDLKEWITGLFQKTLRILNAGKITRAGKIAEDAKKYIQDHFGDENLSVEKIAASLYINSRYLRKVFTENVGMTIVDYITGVRMEKARQLLEKSNIKHAEIARMLGYNDASYFSKCFKKYYGLSPSEYELRKK
jgi:two-component system response regulator YesN